ncbi:glycosyltransferase [Allochromatium vinosum]|uniref:glycosyltransferase n=1 Tax=Allochromatium vinosum TaxID=1049 RepID=UPI001907720E|nr:glycosyltransferase [Allochromatium vinosum]MBK1656098.1 hypothetical protein [Allochromatium vinosum]
MHDKFISLVLTVDYTDTEVQARKFLGAVEQKIASSFSDFEIIIVNNGSEIQFHTMDLNEIIRRNCYIVDLATPVSWDMAVLAGLERANGDYTVIFDINFANEVSIIEEMYEKAIEGHDIVHLRDDQSKKQQTTLMRELFYAALKISGNKKINPRDRNEVLFSRRVLNWIIKNSRGLWYLNDAIVSHGFHIFAMEAEMPQKIYRRRYDQASKLAWSTLVDSPRFLATIARFIILLLVGLTGLSFLNVVMVYFFDHDLLWQEQISGQGWIYTNIVYSIGSLAITALLYIILQIKIIMLEEIRARERYIVERFERI